MNALGACVEDQDCFTPGRATVGAWCNKETSQCERCPDECFPRGVFPGSTLYGSFADFPAGAVPASSGGELCPSPWCCDFGMNGAEFDADQNGNYDGFEKRIDVVSCRSKWKNMNMMVLEGLHPQASPQDFVANGTNCGTNLHIDNDHESGNVHRDFACGFMDSCATAEFSVAMVGTDLDDNLQFVNETAYPVTGMFSTRNDQCSKECETDQDCSEDWRGVKQGAWCDASQCARCPTKCLPLSQHGIQFPLGDGLEEEGDCPSPHCCDFGMDGNEVQRDGLEKLFSVLPCDPDSWRDIGVFVLQGKKLDATPDEFVGDGFACSTSQRQEENQPTSEIEIYCSGFMKECRRETHTVAMIGTGADGTLRFVNETAYPISREFDSHYDSCSVNTAITMIWVLVAVACAVFVCCVCIVANKLRTRNNDRPVAETIVTGDDKKAAEEEGTASSRPQEAPLE